MDSLTRDEFLQHLRDALNHLHHADHLRHSPLATLLGLANRFDTASALRSILTEAIESLRPEGDDLSHSRAWWMHQSLFCCYVQQLSQQVVADQLGMSPRQLRREQHAALEGLADWLWNRFDLQAQVREASGERNASAGVSVTTAEDLAWLKDAPPEKPTAPDQALSITLDLARPLAAQHGVSLRIETPEALPALAVHPVALNQTLLNLLSVAIPRATGNQVTISARALRWAVEIKVQGAGIQSGPSSASDDDAVSLDMAHQLIGLSGGKLNICEDVGTFQAVLTLPAAEQLPVLVIDDNADFLQLLQRYAADTRYRLIGTRDPEQALGLAQRCSPQIILLDVMMPQVDGWRVLAQLRQHPLTSHIPVVVCTILAQEALALSLGASGFLRKPVTRQAFLATLDRQIAQA